MKFALGDLLIKGNTTYQIREISYTEKTGYMYHCSKVFSWVNDEIYKQDYHGPHINHIPLHLYESQILEIFDDFSRSKYITSPSYSFLILMKQTNIAARREFLIEKYRYKENNLEHE